MQGRPRKTLALIEIALRLRGVMPAASAGSRRAGWSLAGRGGAALLALCLVGQTAEAEGEREGQEPRWIPSINVGFDTFEYETKSTARNLLNPPAQRPPATTTRSDSSRRLMVRIGAELMGPRFEGLPGRPRLFAQAGSAVEAISSDNIFRVGDLRGNTNRAIKRFQSIRAGDLRRDLVPPGGNGIPDCMEPDLLNPPQPEPTCATADPGDFEGQGSEIDAEFQDPSWYAALGVAFDVPVGESLLLQVKPSIAYNADQIDLSARIRTVIETDPANEVFEIHEGASSASTTDHSLGLGLELGLALFRSLRPIRTSLYADARFLWLLTDPTTTFSDSVGSYEVRRDDFGIRAGAGVRFSWVGFASR